MAKTPVKSFPAPLSENESMSMRKIDNGWIVKKEAWGGKGYSCQETFSAEKPKIVTAPVSGVKAPKGKPSGLAQAAKMLKK